MDIPREIAADIEEDISDRSGLGNEWDGLDEDIKAEIRSTWADRIMKRLQAA